MHLCHVGKLEQHYNTNMLLTSYVDTKLNQLDDSKKFNFKKGNRDQKRKIIEASLRSESMEKN